MLRCDNGGEYDNTAMKQWCKMKGIRLDFTPPYTPQLNPVSEGYNKTVWEKIRALMYESGLDKKFWGLAAQCTCYILNRCPKSGMKITPYEAWTNRVPDLSNLQIFGSQAYAKNCTI